jgi:hypothetical protein
MRHLGRVLLAAARGGRRAVVTIVAVTVRVAPAILATFVVFMLGCRAVHFMTPSLPGTLDDRVGEVMGLGFSFALNQGGAFVMLAQAAIVVVVGFGVLRLIALVRRRPPIPLAALRPWVLTGAWLGLAFFNTVLDFQPGLLGLLLVTAPVLWWAPRVPAAIVGLAVAGAAWCAIGPTPDRFDVVYGGAWLLFCVLAIAVRPRVARRGEWATGIVLGYAVLQGSTLVWNRLPLFRADVDAQIVGEGNVFHWCEDTRRGRLYATHTSCDIWSMTKCRDDFIAVHDLHDPSHVERLQFFDDDFYGRMMHLLCLPDRVQVAMGPAMVGGHLRLGNVMEFDPDDPSRVTRDLLGDAGNDGTGAIFLHDPARNAVFYVSESHNRVLRLDLGTGERRWIELHGIRTWPPPHQNGLFILNMPGPTSTGPDAVFAKRNTGYFVEWMLGSKVVELDLVRGEEVGAYATNNGANQAVAVDEDRQRLLVTGVWGVEAIDLRTGRRVARLRTPFGPRLPVIDQAHDLIFVPTTFGNHLLVLDRDTLAVVGRLGVGTGGRFAHITTDGTRLFASGGGHTYMWDTATLGRRFGRADGRA